jgi:hypothetical protein
MKGTVIVMGEGYIGWIVFEAGLVWNVSASLLVEVFSELILLSAPVDIVPDSAM